MRKRGLCLFVSCMLLTACQNAGDTSETFEEHAYEANTEYDSVEEFLEDSNETMFVLGKPDRKILLRMQTQVCSCMWRTQELRLERCMPR